MDRALYRLSVELGRVSVHVEYSTICDTFVGMYIGCCGLEEMFPFSVSQATGGRVGVFVFRTEHMRLGEFELEGCDAFEISATTRASNIWSLSGSLERFRFQSVCQL